MGVGDRIRTHDSDDRDEALAAWLESDRPDVLLAVTMEEALDLHGDLARWQVLCKAPYPNTNDARVARRLQDDQWAWYYRTALTTVIQACGRVVRSAEDYGATYLADSSLLDLFDRARGDLPPWFAEQVNAMSKPDLPTFDPATALAGVDTSPAATPDSRRRVEGPGDRRGDPGGSSDDSGGVPENHPLSDAWRS
jgi:Rad3-related DNA helicase